MRFNELKILPLFIKQLEKLGYQEATPIQEEAVPIILSNKDLVACAKTGTGKTLAFVLPLLQKLYLRDESVKYPRRIKVLILAPTRELAIQINDLLQAFKEVSNIKSTAIFGGVRQGKQVLMIERGVDILVATPGRLLDLYQQGLLSLEDVETLVLDEADHMLDMGFSQSVYQILDLLPGCIQTLLFFATKSKEIKKLIKTTSHEPKQIMVSSGHEAKDTIVQQLYFVDKENKAKLMFHLIESTPIDRAIIFVRTKRNVETLLKKFDRAKISAVGLHGGKAQSARICALNAFKENQVRFLVTTDIAARGIDIDDIKYVINIDLPEQKENYLHRIGRTGRYDKSGLATSFCSYLEIPLLKEIEKFIQQKIPVEENPWYPMMDKTKPKKRSKK